MRPLPMVQGRRARLTGVMAIALVLAVLQPGAAGVRAREAQPVELRRAGFELAYNLDRSDALAAFRRAVEADPSDPASYRAIAVIAWLDILFTRGALTADEFLSSLPEANSDMKAPPPDIVAMFRTNLDKAMELAEARLRQHPDDPDAHFQVGAAAGLLAAYTVTVEGSLVGAFRLARRAFSEQERVLELDPSRKDAAFYTGSYRYAVANLSSVKRWLAYLAGFSGGRDRAIRMLEESASYGSDVQVDAQVLLVLVYNKEGRYEDALRLLDGLRRQFPRNRLLWLESGATSFRAGRAPQALAFLDAGIGMFERDTRPKVFGEAALWFAKRGAVRVVAGDAAGAEADLRRALAGEARGWVHGRAHLELGKLADLSRNRTAAISEYRQAAALCGADRDPVGQAGAQRFLDRPYTGTIAVSDRQ